MRSDIEPFASEIFRLRAEMLAEQVAELKVRLAALEGEGCPECARLRETNTRLNDEMAGLYERLAEGDKRQEQRLEDLEQSRDEWRQRCLDLHESISSELAEQDADDLSRYHELVRDDKATLERLRQLEGENAMLRRAKGGGVGRGRMPEWTPVQATQVREAHAAGRSLRQIARDARVTVSQVRTILARPAERPHPVTERDERLVRRVQEIDHLIHGAQVALAQSSRRAAAKQRAAATKPPKLKV